jgi:hypothetical protein
VLVIDAITHQRRETVKHINVCACDFQTKENGPWISGAAVISEPGLSEVSLIIKPDGTALESPPWDYRLYAYRGAVSIPAGVTIRHGQTV